MRFLITGGSGQLGLALADQLPSGQTTSVDLPEWNIADPAQVDRLLRDVAPDVLINCAAYTNVDGCVNDYSTAH